MPFLRRLTAPRRPFGLFDTFFSTLDFVSLYQTFKVSATGMLRNALRGKI